MLSAALQFGYAFGFGLYILGWTITLVHFDSNLGCKIVFQNSVDGIIQSLAYARKLCNHSGSMDCAASILQMEQTC